MSHSTFRIERNGMVVRNARGCTNVVDCFEKGTAAGVFDRFHTWRRKCWGTTCVDFSSFDTRVVRQLVKLCFGGYGVI